MQKGTRRQIRPKILGLVLVVAGGLAFYFISLPDLKLAQESEDWPVTRGTVTSAELVRVESGRSTDRKVTYRPEVKYTYQIEGKVFSASNIVVTTGTSYSYRIAGRILSEYPQGTVVDVYYRPEDPAFAILKPGIRISEVLVAGFMLLFVILGLLILFNILKASPQKT